jgi:putative copper resistance protein D
VSPDLLSVAVRTLGFVGLFQAAGAAFFTALFASVTPNSQAPIRRLGAQAAIIGTVLLAAHQALDAARMADGFAGLIDGHLQSLAWHGSSGNAALLQIMGLCAIALGLRLEGSPGSDIASIGGCIASCAAVLTGHTSVHSQHPLLAFLLAVHLLLVAFWFGALWPLIICSRRESKAAAVAVLRGFSMIAGPLVPCIAIAGLAMALILMPDRASWRSVYGSLVLAKIAAFTALMVLAAWNRWRAVPAIAAGDSAAAGAHLRRVIAIEYLLIVAVLATTAVLTTFYSP